MSEQIKHVSESDFESEVLKSKVLTLVDFWAPWCGPCRLIGPLLDELAPEFAGKVKFTKLNTDENQQLAMRYQIRSIPSLLLFKNGSVVGARVGAMNKEALKTFINASL